MKKILLLFLLILAISSAYCQQLHYIKFIHIGDETKPVGTLIISVEKLIKPTDRGDIDAMFGRSIKTDINTFNLVRNSIRTSKYTVLYKVPPRADGFKIVCSDGKVYYLYGLGIGQFSHRLQVLLEYNEADQHVIDVFDYY